MGNLFGTDGVRGVANVAPMDSETVLRLGRAAAHVMRRSAGRHRVLIGKDTRISGYMLETALCSGITSMGVDVMLVGPLPTPGVAYMTRSMRADAGVMISASHNPYEDNGIKFFGPDGFKLADETENEIERLMEPGHLDELRATPDLVGKAVRIEDARGRYTVFLKNCVERQVSFEGVKVVIDCANGAAYRSGPEVFSELGAVCEVVANTPDGVNINVDCGSTHPERMCKLVREKGADFGIAYDGDADRVIFCDEKGEIFDGDSTLAMLGISWNNDGKLRGGAVAGTVMSNFGLEFALREAGIKLIRSDVGDRNVLLDMQAHGLNLGGEQSGHVIALDHNTTGDGILTSLLVLSAAIKAGKPLSEFQKLITRYPQILINVPVKKKPPIESMSSLQKAIGEMNGKLKDRGRILLRYSGTEPKLRVMVECDDQVLCKNVATTLADVVREEIG
jgi:phosphoglucosamine mutase